VFANAQTGIIVLLGVDGPGRPLAGSAVVAPAESGIRALSGARSDLGSAGGPHDTEGGVNGTKTNE
jgi:hypothetical protein